MTEDIMSSEIFTPGMEEQTVKGTGKLLNIIFIVDVSGSMKEGMQGETRIDAVNTALTKMIPALRQIQIDNMSKFELRIAIMTFNYEANWIVNPTPVMEYVHDDIECTQWRTFYSKAFEKLNEKLSRNEFMAHTGKIAVPYIMFLTDGEPSKEDNYEPALNKLLSNGWFKASQRFAVLMGKEAINSEAARTAVGSFVTNSKEGIINAVDAETICAEVQANTLHTVDIITKHGFDIPDLEDGSNIEETDKASDSDTKNDDDNGGFGGFGGFGAEDGFDDGSFA